MRFLSIILSWIGMVFAGMFGGQKDKNVRRFGLPAIAVGESIGYDGFQWKDLVFLILIPILCLGYGVDSVLGNALGHIEWMIRFVYAVLLSIPFIFYGLMRWLIAAILLIIAFQIHAGAAHIGWFDVLWEDVIRYGVLGGLVISCLIFKRK